MVSRFFLLVCNRSPVYGTIHAQRYLFSDEGARLKSVPPELALRVLLYEAGRDR
jgi:hypothetical protein